jgi:hypothetical protein
MATFGYGNGLYGVIFGITPHILAKRDRRQKTKANSLGRNRGALMDFNANNIGYTISAYIITAVFVVGLTAVIIFRDRMRAKKLSRQISKDQP